jgi:hypothetical protein
MLRDLRRSLIDPGKWQQLAVDGDLDDLVANMRQAQEHGAEDDAGELAESIAFVERLREAEAAAASEDPIRAIELVYGVPLPTSGRFRAKGPEILDARAKGIVEAAMDRAWEAEQGDPRKAEQLYADLAEVLDRVDGPEAYLDKVDASRRYVFFMSHGSAELEGASGVEGFEAADQAFQRALENSGLDPDRREAREAAARRRIQAVVTDLESHTAKVWPRTEAEWKSRPEEELQAAAELWLLYSRIMNRERGMPLEEADRRLGELAREQGD